MLQEIPLLVSRTALRRGRVRIDPQSDTMVMAGTLRHLNYNTESGLYYMLLSGNKSSSSGSESLSSQSRCLSPHYRLNSSESYTYRDQKSTGISQSQEALTNYVIHLD